MEAADRRAVEPDAVPEGVLVDDLGRDRQVLEGPEQIDKLEVEKFDLELLDLLEHVECGDLVFPSH
jgi:hypothetical protein